MAGQAKKPWQESVKLRGVIRELSKTGNVSEALRLARASRSWVYERRQTDADFSDAFDAAKKCGLEVLQDEAHRRAYDGVLEPKTINGKRELVRKYSDNLLMFLIKQADPSYREHFQLEHATAGGRPFLFQMMLHPDAVKASQQAEGGTQ